MSLCRQVKLLDVEREQKTKQLCELQTRLSLDEQKDEERARELISLKQRLAETEASRNSLQKEVRALLITGGMMSSDSCNALLVPRLKRYDYEIRREVVIFCEKK